MYKFRLNGQNDNVWNTNISNAEINQYLKKHAKDLKINGMV